MPKQIILRAWKSGTKDHHGNDLEGGLGERRSRSPLRKVRAESSAESNRPHFPFRIPVNP